MIEGYDITENIRKKMAHDLTPCGRAQEFMEVLNLMPGSDEVEQMEHEASHDRIDATAPINDVVLVLAGLAGETVGRVILEDRGMEQDETLVNVYETVARASAQVVIAHLLELNLIHIGGHP